MALEAGWYADPFGRHEHRYFDGSDWTAQVGDNGVVSVDDMPLAADAAGAVGDPGASRDAGLAALQEADERGDAEASVLLGQALRKVGRYDEARAAYERGDQRGHPEAAMSLGNMLVDVGDTAGARVAFERGIAAGSTMAALNLGLLLLDMGEGDEALRFLRIARDQHGDDVAYWAIGKLLEERGDRLGAIESYQAGAAAGHAPAAFALGRVLYDLGDNEGAKAAFQQADALGDVRAKELLEAFAREPDNALGRQLAHQLANECHEAMTLYSACSAASIDYQKAIAVANQPQHPISRDRFLDLAREYEQNFLSSLSQLRAMQESARTIWNDVLFHSGKQEQGMDKVVVPLLTEGSITMDQMNAIMIGGFVVKADFGTTMESFFEADARVAAAMQSILAK